MKKCSKCNILKVKEKFYRLTSSMDGLKPHCKECDNLSRQLLRRTKHGLICAIYATQKTSSKKRGQRLPTYSKEEFLTWMYSQENFNKLFSEWEESGFNKKRIPSVDRKDDYVGYTIENIQLVTWDQNNQKAYRDRKNGINNKANTPVLQLTISNDLVATFYSVSEASRVTGVNPGNIHSCCNGTIKSAGGFIWKHKNTKDTL